MNEPLYKDRQQVLVSGVIDGKPSIETGRYRVKIADTQAYAFVLEGALVPGAPAASPAFKVFTKGQKVRWQGDTVEVMGAMVGEPPKHPVLFRGELFAAYTMDLAAIP